MIVSLFILILTITNARPLDKILLKDVNGLTLNQGQYTTGRRSSPIHQLNCIGGTAKSENYKVKTIQCTNTGFDGKDYNWKCDASLPKSLRLGDVRVSCEGYDYPDDPYILVGSCGLKYTLEYNEEFIKSTPIYQQEITKPSVIYKSEYSALPIPVNNYTIYDSLTMFVSCIGLLALFFLIMSDKPTASVSPTVPVSHVTPTIQVSHVTPAVQVVPVPVVHKHYDNYNSRSSFFDGVAIGSALSHRSTLHVTPVHTHTTYSNTHINVKDDTKTDHVSTSYGGTERR